MKLNELITKIREAEPKTFNGIPDPLAMRLVRASLSVIGATVDACEEGRVPVFGLGIFIVTKKAAADTGKTNRIVRFRSLKPGPGGKGKGKGKEKGKGKAT